MNKKQAESLIRPFCVRCGKVGLVVLFSALAAVGAHARTGAESGGQPPRDRNSELRNGTWSISAHLRA